MIDAWKSFSSDNVTELKDEAATATTTTDTAGEKVNEASENTQGKNNYFHKNNTINNSYITKKNSHSRKSIRTQRRC